jgi:CO2 hydration protein
MVTSQIRPSKHPLAEYIHRLEAGQALLKDTPDNLMEVVGILDSYGIVLDAYSINLNYTAASQFLVLFPVFRYFNGEVNPTKLFRYLWHDRINYEYAEYCMKTMLWHGGGGLDAYLDSSEFIELAQKAIHAKTKSNLLIQSLHALFPDFLFEQIRQLAYYSGLGQFWRVMSDIFTSLADLYNQDKITSIPAVVQHVQDGLVAAAGNPITYSVTIKGKDYPLIPESAGLTFLPDTAIPYVESIFFRGTPFPGTVSYNAQAYQIPYNQEDFGYGALFADPLPVGTAGVPPTLLMQDMRHFLPDYLRDFYNREGRREGDIRVKICQSFQKSMFCVTTAAIKGLAPHPLDTDNPDEQAKNRAYLEGWMNRFPETRLISVNH